MSEGCTMDCFHTCLIDRSQSSNQNLHEAELLVSWCIFWENHCRSFNAEITWNRRTEKSDRWTYALSLTQTHDTASSALTKTIWKGVRTTGSNGKTVVWFVICVCLVTQISNMHEPIQQLQAAPVQNWKLVILGLENLHSRVEWSTRNASKCVFRHRFYCFPPPAFETKAFFSTKDGCFGKINPCTHEAVEGHTTPGIVQLQVCKKVRHACFIAFNNMSEDCTLILANGRLKGTKPGETALWTCMSYRVKRWYYHWLSTYH